MQIMIKKLSDKAILPTRMSKEAAGYDLYVTNDGIIRAGETKMFHTDIAMSIPKGYFGAIFARSGLSSRSGLRPATCVSVIDSDYTGENGVPIHNDSDEDQIVCLGQRVAQMIIMKHNDVDFVEVDELPETERGSGGYGSSGK